MTLTPTQEQRQCLDLFATEGNLAITARAGTGKTATLVMLAESAPRRRGLYVAFNKSVVADIGGRLPGSTACSTAHSLAFREVGKRYSHRLNGSRMRSNDVARFLRLDPFIVNYGSQRKVLAPGFLAGLVMRGINIFCQSDAETPKAEHLPYVDGIDLPNSDGSRRWENNNELRRHVENAMRAAWDDLRDPNGQLRFTHDHYLTIWALGQPRLSADYVLCDEAQDLSARMVSVLFAQDAQVIAVGDECQQIYCQPAGTMVRTVVKVRRVSRGGPGYEHRDVPIESLRPGDQVVTWNRNWRNGGIRKLGCAVASVDVRQHDGEVVIAEVDGCTSRYTPEHHCVALVGDALRSQFVVYMMRRGDQYRVGRTHWQYESQGGQNGLILRAGAEKADAVWVLSSHATVGEAALAESLAQVQFGLPSLCFERHANDLIDVEAFWSKVGDNTEQARVCLSRFGRLLAHPLWTRGDYKQFSRGPIVTAAANLMTGMRMLAVHNAKHKGKSTVSPDSCWTPAKISREWFTGPVVSIGVDTDHTYVADGIVTHNSWRGSVNAMTDERLALRATLSQSFRFGPEVAAVANEVLGMLDADPLVRGTDSIASTVGSLPDPAAILTRTNAAAVDAVLAAQEQGRAPHLVGGGAEVVSFAKAARELMQDGRTWHPELACFDSWGEVQDYVEHDQLGGELRLLVGLVEKYGVPTILRALDAMVPEQSADVIVSTSHKAKGREWSSVKLGSDFPAPKEGRSPPPEELRLLYVAVTRAKLELDVDAVGILNQPEEDRGEVGALGRDGGDPAAAVVGSHAPASPEPTAFELTERFGGKRP